MLRATRRLIFVPAAFLATILLASCNAKEANEASAITTLRVIITAQITYSATCTKGGFATTLEDLARPSRQDGYVFLPPDLGKTGTVKSGYKITVARDAAKNVSDVGSAAATCNGSANAPATSFFASAEPVRPGVTGSRFFAADERAIVFYSTAPISNPIVESPTVQRLQ
jgi:hypothetical protein